VQQTKNESGHVARNRLGKCAYNLVGNPEVNRPLRRPGHRLKYNTEIYRKVTDWEGVEWIHLA
jgi:hypothetical protein